MAKDITSIKMAKKHKQSFISSEKGQRFFNFAYSIGAAIVIWGALFKILHLPGGNTLLSIGMGTEVLMFVLTAFDRPPREYNWEKVYPQLDKKYEDEDADADSKVKEATADETEENAEKPSNGDDSFLGQDGPWPVSDRPRQSETHHAEILVAEGPVTTPASNVASATQNYLEQLNGITEEMAQLRQSTQALNHVSEILLDSYRTITENSENITRSSQGYVQQMGDLSRNIQGLNTIYEIQLKSISSQLDAIDRVNKGIKDIRDMYEKSSVQSARYAEETEKMARYMQQLNSVYEKMITAMTINMYNPMMAQTGNPTATNPETTSENND